MRTVAIVARKGGSGKTTVAVHMAVAAHLAGRRTLLLDTDPQQSATEVLQLRGHGPGCAATPATDLLQAKFAAEREGVDALLIDTPAGTEEGMSNAIVLADLCLLVIRPTFLDLAAAVYTVEVLRKLRRAVVVVLNQAPVARDGVEPPAVKKALEALRMMRLPVAPSILRARASYQNTIEAGRSAVELTPQAGGARELADLWAFVERFAFPARPEARLSA
jgi:chromosome partitioning protein